MCMVPLLVYVRFFLSRVRQPELNVYSLLGKWWLQDVSLQTLSQTTMFDTVRCGEFDKDVERTRGNFDVRTLFYLCRKIHVANLDYLCSFSTWTTSTYGTTRHPSQTEATSWSWRAPAPNSFLFTALEQHCNGHHCFAKISNTCESGQSLKPCKLKSLAESNTVALLDIFCRERS